MKIRLPNLSCVEAVALLMGAWAAYFCGRLVWRLFVSLFIILVLVDVASADHRAVVMLPSHGCSGTVIHTENGRTLILTCAHAFEGADRSKRIAIKAPHPSPGAKVGTASPRVINIDYRNDLCLIEMNAGPLPYVCPVGPLGTPAQGCLSAGYDEMRLPATVKRATVLASGNNVTWTAEMPWHGRSGGALINEKGYLIGVVQGYENAGQRRGVYASHRAVLSFLAGNGMGSGTQSPQRRMPSPSPQPYSQPRQWAPQSAKPDC